MRRSRIQKVLPLHRPKEQPWIRDAGHLARIRQCPCAACGSRDRVEAAHVRLGTDGCMARKPSDRWTVPLCWACHHNDQHKNGELTFWASRGIDVYALCDGLWLASKKGLDAMERVMFRHLMRLSVAVGA